MPKPWKTKKHENPQDVSVNDFANSKTNKIRSKKFSMNVSYIIENELELKDNWDDEIEEVKGVRPTASKKKSRINIKHEEGKNYPSDVWFLISNYIRPEDVGRFAAICKTSLEVTLSAQFWKSLYKRYYRDRNLPDRYQPECLLRYFGLATTVIKALFFMYTPFSIRAQKIISGITHPDCLLGKQCIRISVEQEGKLWIYYVKFKLNNSQPFYREDPEKQDIIGMLNDIHTNLEKDYCLLKITSNEYVPFPPVIGKTLRLATLTLSKGFCNQRLQLVFGSKITDQLKSNQINGDLVVLDSVKKIHVLDWWHPSYISNERIIVNNDDWWHPS